MPAGTLKGRHIAVTRPPAQCAALVEAIRERGGDTLVLPLILIEPLLDTTEIRAVSARLDDYDMAFFVSPNAVIHGLAAMRRLRAWPAHLTVATVGEGSRRVLEQSGFDRVVAPEAGSDSEAVLALPEFAAPGVTGKKVVIFRGNGGRDLLGDTLRARGAEVSYVSCYRRKSPSGGVDVLVDAFKAGALDALTLTSSEAADNLARLLGPEHLASLAEVPVFVPHERIARRCEGLGFRQVIRTAPGDQGLLAALGAHFGSLG